MNTTDKDKQSEGFKALTLDIDTYQALLDDPELSDDQKREFLETIWSIVVQFVDMGFGVEATQLALNANEAPRDPNPVETSPVLGRLFDDAGVIKTNKARRDQQAKEEAL